MSALTLSTTYTAPEQETLNNVLARIGMEIPAIRAFQRHPELHGIALRLCQYITDIPMSPFNGRRLVDTCIEQALAGYYRKDADNPAHGFVRTLVSRSTDVINTHVSDLVNTWDVMAGEPLAAFLSRHPAARVSYQPVKGGRPTPAALRRHMAQMLLSPESLVALGITHERASQPLD